mgnify:CR=1 FL=1
MKKTYKIEVDCANCANLMENAARKTDGVSAATVNFMTQKMIVEFEEGKFADYTFKQADELELAYATTIHKAQGSEYPAVVIPLLGGPRMLMTRNLLYTAVTRARKCVTIVGSDVTFQAMIGNHIEANRYTTLARRIWEMREENA